MTATTTSTAKVVVITGASSGLGEATAQRLARVGHSVVLGARRLDRLTRLVADLESSGGSAVAQHTNVTDRGQVQALVDLAVNRSVGSTSSSTTPACPSRPCSPPWKSKLGI